MALIDLHCHLDLYPEPTKVAKEAAARGVYVLSVTTTPKAYITTKALAPLGSHIRTALGLHPELAAEREAELALFEQLLPTTSYVGEVGLDGSRHHRVSLDQQAGILMQILFMCARCGGKAISLHSREAANLLLDLLSAEPMAGTPILHWFTGTSKQTRRAAEMGCWFSVGTSMLKSRRGKEAVTAMPRDRVLPETDGPFAIRSGRPSYPWEAMQVCESLAAIWNEPAEVVRGRLVNNFKVFVSKVV